MQTETANERIQIHSELLDKVRREARTHGITTEEFLNRLLSEYFASTEVLAAR
jgi:hypothetical protein